MTSAAIDEAERSPLASEKMSKSFGSATAWHELPTGRGRSPTLTTSFAISRSEIRRLRAMLCARSMTVRSIAEQPYGSERTNDPDIRLRIVRRYRYKIYSKLH